MTDHPIIFSRDMVRALMACRKTQTRRLAWQSYRTQKLQPLATHATRPSPWQRVEPGDRLWVREAWAPRFDVENESDDQNQRYVKYRADSDDASPSNEMDWHTWPRAWRPSIHMPRWASRLTLTVTATKIERLNNISEGDAVLEGMAPMRREQDGGQINDPREDFCELWDKLHGPGAWDANPEVVALTFTVARENIDRDRQQNGGT